MAYGKKSDPPIKCILQRVKDLSTLVAGKPYHLRKMLRMEGNAVFDEVHDIIFKEIEGEFIVDEITGDKFSSKEFEVFFRR